MIKLVNLLKEIKVFQSIPKFKTNTDLFNYLKKNPDLKNQLVNEWYIKVLEKEAPREWYYSTLEQKNHDGFYENDGKAPDKNDPVLIISLNENILYVSIESLKKDDFPGDGTIIKFGPNMLYIDHI